MLIDIDRAPWPLQTGKLAIPAVSQEDDHDSTGTCVDITDNDVAGCTICTHRCCTSFQVLCICMSVSHTYHTWQ